MARVIRADNREPGVIPAQVVSAHERARAIVADAEHRADALRADAEREGRAVAEAALAKELLRMAEALDLERASLREAAIEIALQAARRVIGQALTERPELVRQSVTALLARVRRARSVTVRVHPDDQATLGPELASLRERSGLDGTLRFESDASLTRGGCVVHSDVGSLDARIETQLAALERALKSAR